MTSLNNDKLPQWVTSSNYTVDAKLCMGGAQIARLLNMRSFGGGPHWNVDLTPEATNREKLVSSHTFDQWYMTEAEAREVYDNIEKVAFVHWATKE